MEVKNDVERELAWDPVINSAGIGVEVRDRVVTLAGHLDSYVEKLAARKAAQRFEGVKGVVVELDVRLPDKDKRTDEEIAEAAREMLQWHTGLDENAVKLSVEKGCLTLCGEVGWGFQMKAAEKAVTSLRGVMAVVNQITVRGRPTPIDIADRIAEALERHALKEARRIVVSIDDGTVTLRGKMGSFAEKSISCNSAWSAPGVRMVIDQLSVRRLTRALRLVSHRFRSPRVRLVGGCEALRRGLTVENRWAPHPARRSARGPRPAPLAQSRGRGKISATRRDRRQNRRAYAA
ncbi:BON domain-containing protein [Paraburkholderia atlantica]|uniref:BON domain-containing protein n=1 Tax=Paraburkholderia atlantica TaxID=2654982 RepID=UPI003D2369E4